MLAINSSESESTGYSPAYLTQGRKPRLPKALYDEVTIGSGARCVSPDAREKELKEIFQIVRRNLETAAQKQKHHYNLRRRHWTPKVGDLVLVRQHPLSKATDKFTAKLAPKFGGPFIVTGFVSPVITQLKAVDNHEKRTAHLSELKEFHSNNQFLFLSSPRSHKTLRRPTVAPMDAKGQRSEKYRGKFRENYHHFPSPESMPSPLNSTIAAEDITPDKLPPALRPEIDEYQLQHKGARRRRIREIGGKQHRIPITREGVSRVKVLATKPNVEGEGSVTKQSRSPRFVPHR